jgi:SAM-dependent MidA family methyltransferase
VPALEDYFRRLGLLPGEDCQAEVNLDALDWMKAAARALGRGFVMTFDYGYPADQLYAPWRRQGTFLCFYRHNASVDPYVRVGRQDMTSHVDFTSLIQAGEEAGLQTVGLTSQARFLDALGIGGALSGAAQAELSLEEYYARRRALTELLDPAGLGRIRCSSRARAWESRGCWVGGVDDWRGAYPEMGCRGDLGRRGKKP